MPLTVETGIVNLAVEDLERSLAFYVGQLGCEVIERAPDDWTLLRAGDLQIALVPTGQPVEPQATTLLLLVPNINRALRELTRAGVTIASYSEDHEMAQFNDPDGHRLAVMQSRREIPDDSR